MEEISNVLINFITSLRSEILDYYSRVYQYIKDLFADKSIDLKFKTSYESDKTLRDTVENMVKIVKLALQTIGVPRKDIKLIEKPLEAATQKKGDDYPDYNAYFEKDIKIHIDKFLFRFLVEYLIDYDFSKIENLDLFDLLPRRFTTQLDQFKENFMVSTSLKRLINNRIEEVGSYIDYNDFSFIGPSKKEITSLVEKPMLKTKDLTKKEAEPIPKSVLKPKIEPKEPIKVQPTPKDVPKPIIATEKPSIDIEALKASIKSSVVKSEPATPQVKASAKPASIPSVSPKVEPPSPPKTPPAKDTIIAREAPPSSEVSTIVAPPAPEVSKTFLDTILYLSPINQAITSKININKENLIECQTFNGEYFNLEALFHYISILKMLDLNIPYTPEDILNLTQNYLNGDGIFSTSVLDYPDPINVFYGLAIYSEMGLINNGSIDLLNIEIFLEAELSNFIPENLHLNFYALLALKILEKEGSIISDKSNLLNPLLSMEISDVEGYIPVLDIFEQLSMIKLIDKSTNLNHFKALYAEEIKKLIDPETGSVKQTITDSARTLLTFSLLELHKQEFNITQKLLKYISSTTEYFSSEMIKEEFNWKIDKFGFYVELRMLYWALLASSQFNVII
ncbi:MAG: hypothetical protein ACTSR8_11745 [Promethearchaeota archaeon]